MAAPDSPTDYSNRRYTPSMPQDWDFYHCQVDDHPALVYLDLEAGETIDHRRSHLWRVSIPLKAPSSEGLAEPSEASALEAVEDDLFEHVCRSIRARYVGRLTTQGHREFFYYAPVADGVEERVREALATHPGYPATVRHQTDPDWHVYFELLYPSSVDLQSIYTRQQLEEMNAIGEDLSTQLEVVHRVAFPSQEARIEFTKQLDNEGFTISELDELESGNPDLPYALTVTRRERMELTTLDGLVTDLLLRAEDSGGEYLDWHVKFESH